MSVAALVHDFQHNLSNIEYVILRNHVKEDDIFL